MTGFGDKRLAMAAAALLLVAIGAGAGVLISQRTRSGANDAATERKVLYWYDPMVPNERYPGPGKSSMNMDTIPKYADEVGSGAGVRIDPSLTQNLGARFAFVRRGVLEADAEATAVIDFNQRDIAVVQARADGFVRRVYDRAPGDVIAAGAPLVDLLIPSWGGAQAEYLAVRRTGDTSLIRAARQRLVLLGMSEALIAAIERSGRARNTITITAPAGGVVKTLGVRSGMSVAQGATLAEINGLTTVWLNAAIPEALAGQLRVGQSVAVTLAAFPGERFTGRLTALLPELVGDSRTVTARIEMDSRGGRLRPGMFGRITFGGGSTSALLVPTEAVIRTGERDLVMLALPEGRFQAAEVRIGREAGGRTEVLAGLREGERIVASGQFLIDSEANMSGVAARPIGEVERAAAAPLAEGRSVAGGPAASAARARPAQ
ncbi:MULTISPECIES: efflux RND transporter periplasmic adaptor subunit [unclassified Brevundimonas]|jgi:Cu(I)/Ag(I) efflux system membrane fusion protein|nr:MULTISPECIES: efflux RND transporter periplasmic adaptor subunit [unclassified Brevundimonas]MCK6105248.1 efflux RND transporter periplasmic adaptor subunit [Brevundimonas sp. EYE_349]